MKYRSTLKSLVFFVIALLTFTGISFLLRTFMGNFDENDHIAAGYLMSEGKKLYTDIFSHHFPLPYYWTYLFTFLWSIESPARTIGIFRLSLTVLYIIVFTIVYFFLQKEKTRLWFSVWIILFSLFYPIYQGNLILSESFIAVFISGYTWILLPILLKWEKYSFLKGVVLLFFAAGTFWAQPSLFMLFVIPFLFHQNMNERVKLLVIASGLIAVPLLLFWLNGQLFDFIEQSIWFNSNVYPKYYFDDPLQQKNLPLIAIPIVLFIKNEFSLFTLVTNWLQIFQFIAHISVYIILIKFVRDKSYKYLFIFILLLMASRIREIKINAGVPFNFGILPFLIVASICALYLISILFRKNKVIGVITFIIITIGAFYPVRPIITQSLDRSYNYHVFWSYRQEAGQLIKQLTLPEEPILIYPHDVDLYYFADRHPPDRFLYWFPWIDSVKKYRQERLYALEKNSPAVIYVGSLAFYGDKNYYMRFFPELTKDYIQVKKDGKKTQIWLRSDLQERLEL